MRKELITTKAGSRYYSFVYYNTVIKKQVRFRKDYINTRFGKDILDPQEATDILKILSKEIASKENEKINRAEWAEENESFQELIELYLKHQKKVAPNSYENSLHFLKYYVLHYFLQIARCKDLNEWPYHYLNFKEWLEEKATVTAVIGRKISYSSKNHCIAALNSFMRNLYRHRIISSYIACERFPEHTLAEKNLDDVIPLEEMEKVYRWLKNNCYKKEATFWRLLYFTGMRFNEAKGISVENTYEGKIGDVTFEKRLSSHKISYFGYLVINSQPQRKGKMRNKEGHILRKPLKGKKKIDEKSARIIPVIDSLVWKELAELYNEEIPKMKKKIWGDSMEDYVLFENIKRDPFIEAYKCLKITYHHPHCCRHTRATLLIGETGDALLTRMWLGHSSQKVLDKYVHIYQACARKAKKCKDQTKLIRVDKVKTSRS